MCPHVGLCFILMFINGAIALFQTLTTADENKQINGARIQNLSPTTVSSGSYWDLFVTQDNDQWGLWIKTDSTWGFDSTLPSSYNIQLHGNTSSASSDLLISISDGIDSKYSTIIIRLNGQTQNLIAPGCDNIHSPLQSFMSGDVYYTMADNPPPGNRLCRPANNCSYATFGPGNKIIWPMIFTINNYPVEQYSTISFESNGYSSIHCGFGEAFLPNYGTNIWITALVNDNYEISKINLNYTLLPIPTTANLTTFTQTTSKPSTHPSKPTVYISSSHIINSTQDQSDYAGNISENHDTNLVIILILILILICIFCAGVCVILSLMAGIKITNQYKVKHQSIPVQNMDRNKHDYDKVALQIANEEKQQVADVKNNNYKSDSEQLYVQMCTDHETKMGIEMYKSNISRKRNERNDGYESLKSWFDVKVNIPNCKNIYYQLFVDHGYDTLEIVQLLNEDKLRKMEIKKQGHIDKIMLEINNLKFKAQYNETEGGDTTVHRLLSLQNNQNNQSNEIIKL